MNTRPHADPAARGEPPIGEPVPPGGEPRAPRRRILQGRHVVLAPTVPEGDVDELYAASHGGAQRNLWTYLPYGPFADRVAMLAWLERCAESADPLFLTVTDRRAGRRVGMVSFLNVVPGMRRLELGHIWYAPSAQRTAVNTESVYLMLCEAFDGLRYRRVEWKCDALNARSRTAAGRLGFSFEGVFRQHMVVKGRNRDTAWFAMLDRDWQARKANLERWLYGEGPRPSLRELNAPLLRPPAR